MPHTETQPLPRWLKRNVPKGNVNHFTARLIDELRLETVCDHARCPNRMECYAQKTATFMVLGDVCTRRCGFCAVAKGKTRPPDATEPDRVAEAARRLGLRHVVLTMVARDDLADGGAGHVVRTMAAVRRESPSASVEVLISDLAGNLEALDRILDARPEVLNHNSETVPRLYRAVRGRKADFGRTLDIFRRASLRAPMGLKSGLMLGLGETREELLDTLADLHGAGCRLLTLGQYLRPSLDQMPVVRYLPPEEFAELGQIARRMGFAQVASGPFVRSSYHAREMMP